MSQPDPVDVRPMHAEYATPGVDVMRRDEGLTADDVAHLNTLGILHYVWGGIGCAFAPCGLIYIAFGLIAAIGGGTSGDPDAGAAVGVGVVFGVIGLVIITLTLGAGLLNIWAGRCLRQRRGRGVILTASVLNCLSVPLGLILAIFTFVVTGRPQVRDVLQAG